MAGFSTSLLLAGGAASAGSSIMGGELNAKSILRKSEYDAQIYEQQAGMIAQKKKIAEYQFNRQAAAVRGSIISQTAGKGLTLSGSPLAILIDNESQMQFDKAIQDYNFDIEKNYAMSAAASTREQGVFDARASRVAGYTNAFSTLLNVGANTSIFNKPGAVLGSSKRYYPGYKLPSATRAGYARGY